MCHVTSFFESMLAREFNRGQMSQQEVEQPNTRSTMPNVTSQRRMAMRSNHVFFSHRSLYRSLFSGTATKASFLPRHYWCRFNSPGFLAFKCESEVEALFTLTTTSFVFESHLPSTFHTFTITHLPRVWMHLPSPPPLASKSKRGQRQYAWYAFTTTTTSLALECQAAVDFLGASICLARLR